MLKLPRLSDGYFAESKFRSWPAAPIRGQIFARLRHPVNVDPNQPDTSDRYRALPLRSKGADTPNSAASRRLAMLLGKL
jgi:hypothetical protein